MRESITELRIPVYNEDRHTGVLRHVVGRVGENGELMVVLVTATTQLPREKEFVKALRKRLPHVVSIHQNIQTYRNNVIMGRETNLLWGKPTILDRKDNNPYNNDPKAYFLDNKKPAEKF